MQNFLCLNLDGVNLCGFVFGRGNMNLKKPSISNSMVGMHRTELI